MKKHRAITTDAIIIHKGKLLLIKRKCFPSKGYYALPGGHVEYDETIEAACIREVKEETGLKVKIVKLAGVYSDPGRDPGRHAISICYICKPLTEKLKAGDDAMDAGWFDIKKLPGKIAFDHRKIIGEVVGDQWTVVG